MPIVCAKDQSLESALCHGVRELLASLPLADQALEFHNRPSTTSAHKCMIGWNKSNSSLQALSTWWRLLQ